MYNKKFLPTILLLIVGLVGCGGMRLKQFNHVAKREADYTKEKEGVEVRVRKLTRKECPTAKLVPLRITVRNRDAKKVVVDANDVGIETASIDKVYAILSKSPGGRVFAGSLASLAVTPILVMPTLIFATIGAGVPAAVLTAVELLPLVGFGIFGGGIVGGFRATDYNAQLRYYLNKHMLKTIKMSRGEKKTRLIFVPKEAYHVPFSISVTKLGKKDGNVVKQQVLFNVKI